MFTSGSGAAVTMFEMDTVKLLDLSLFEALDWRCDELISFGEDICTC